MTADQITGNFRDYPGLINDFVNRVPDVTHAMILSQDGLRLTSSSTMGVTEADKLAAIASGVLGMARSGGKLFDMGGCEQIIHRHNNGYFLFMHIGTGGGLVVLTGSDCDMQEVAYQMTRFVMNLTERQPRHAATEKMGEVRSMIGARHARD